jgi:GTP cyclohydrolase IB
MNAPDRIALADVQSRADGRNLRIDAVGVKGLRYPVTLRTDRQAFFATVATFAMTVALDPSQKGTHMSRFVELLEAWPAPLEVATFEAFVTQMLQRLDAPGGSIELRFPYFVRKQAPVSGTESFLDYDVCWRGSVSEDGEYAFRMRVAVPATSLCPCSREISAYGAHNQRSVIGIEAELLVPVAVEELIAIAERSASCEVYGLLKRPDEKYVTERAYDNPRFVEDLVREVALALNRDDRIGRYVVEAENFESIHNHSAFASISSAERHGQP